MFLKVISCPHCSKDFEESYLLLYLKDLQIGDNVCVSHGVEKPDQFGKYVREISHKDLILIYIEQFHIHLTDFL